MIVVLAHPGDQAGAELVRRWRANDARLLTSADLSRPGWRVASDDPGSAGVVIDGEPVAVERITGVLVRTPAIESAELAAVVPEDRDYCAAEMTAFLTWWLTGLAVPVINRPSATSLAGPGWRAPRWQVEAQRIGLASAAKPWRVEGSPGAPSPPDGAEPADRNSADWNSADRNLADRGPAVVVTVVAGRPVGPSDPALAGAAVRLARAARAQALAVGFDPGFDPPRFRWAQPWVDVGDPAVADALLAALRS